MADPDSLPAQGTRSWYSYALSLRDAVVSKINRSGDTMSGNLSVPTPTQDAHASTKLYVDNQQSLKVSKAGDTMTGNLNLDGTGYLRLYDTDGTTNQRRFVAYVAGNRLDILRTNDDGSGSVNSIRVWGDDGAVQFYAPEVIVPAISGTSQAAQVTAYDAATGRLAIGGREIGDTGYRDISGLLINGWTEAGVAGRSNIRRSGNTVSLQLNGLNRSAATLDRFMSAISGFMPRLNGWLVGPPTSNPNQNPIQLRITDSTGFEAVSRVLWSVDTAYVTFVWLTDETWPTTLPGTAA